MLNEPIKCWRVLPPLMWIVLLFFNFQSLGAANFPSELLHTCTYVCAKYQALYAVYTHIEVFFLHRVNVKNLWNSQYQNEGKLGASYKKLNCNKLFALFMPIVAMYVVVLLCCCYCVAIFLYIIYTVPHLL